MTAEQEWYFVRNGQQDGPHTLAQIKQWVAQQRIAAGDLVWAAHLPDWMPAQALPEFAEVLRSGMGAPPPVPQSQPVGSYPNARPLPGSQFPDAPYGQPGGAYPQQAHYQGGDPRLQGATPGIVITGFIFSFLCPIVGFILCVIGLQEAKKRRSGEGLAVAGIVISVVNFILGLILFSDGPRRVGDAAMSASQSNQSRASALRL